MAKRVRIQDHIFKQYIVCGLGNPVLTDDAVGILLVRDLLEKCDSQLRKLIDFRECQIGILDFLDDFSGYRHLLIIDSIVTNTERPGTLILCEPEDARGLSYGSTVGIHGLNFPTLLRLGRMLGSFMPETCTIAGIVVSECKHFGMGLSPDLESRYPELLNKLLRFIAKWTNTGEEHVMINHRYKDTEMKYGE